MNSNTNNIIREQIISTVDLIGQLLLSIQITGKMPPDDVLKAGIILLAKARNDLENNA
jgi:hypothetical protein